MNQHPTCGECRHFDEVTSTCRRCAISFNGFPKTRTDTWCGQHEFAVAEIVTKTTKAKAKE